MLAEDSLNYRYSQRGSEFKKEIYKMLKLDNDLLVPAIIGLGLFAQNSEMNLANNTSMLIILFLLLRDNKCCHKEEHHHDGHYPTPYRAGRGGVTVIGGYPGYPGYPYPPSGNPCDPCNPCRPTCGCFDAGGCRRNECCDGRHRFDDGCGCGHNHHEHKRRHKHKERAIEKLEERLEKIERCACNHHTM